VTSQFVATWEIHSIAGLAQRLPEGGYLANTGGPCSRTRTERLRATVLGQDDGAIRCRRVLRVAIDFGQSEPRACLRRWLHDCGFVDGDEARAAIALPPGPSICRADPALAPTLATALKPVEGLRLALVLGLSTPWIYDPRRPLLWTVASLTRRLELFDGGGFYA
jgi:hypothetical protein